MGLIVLAAPSQANLYAITSRKVRLATNGEIGIRMALGGVHRAASSILSFAKEWAWLLVGWFWEFSSLSQHAASLRVNCRE
jgi:hypothetical protein